MDKETSNIEEDFNIDDLLGEDDDSPVEEEIVEEAVVAPAAKKRGRPKGVAKKEAPVDASTDVTTNTESTRTEKDLSDMDWQPVLQQAYDGYQNIKTGEIIDQKEAIRRCLCYAQEAARNSR